MGPSHPVTNTFPKQGSVHMIKGFRDFILRGNVVDLAVAVLIGAAFGQVVTSLSKNLITPIFALIGGKPDFTALKFTIGKAEFGYGAFITDLIGFLITAHRHYFAVVVPVNKALAKLNKPEAEAEAVLTKDQELLIEIRDALKKPSRAAVGGARARDPANTAAEGRVTRTAPCA